MSGIPGMNVGPWAEQDQHATAERLAADGHTSTVGRTHHSSRRWSWGVRCVAGLAVETFEDGSRFEPVATYPAARP